MARAMRPKPARFSSIQVWTAPDAFQVYLALRGESVILVYLSWAAEFLLQLSGAALNWKTSKLLSALLGFLCLTDIVLFIFFQASANTLYPWASWAQQTGRYLLLIFLACEIIGMFLPEADRKKGSIVAGFMAVGIASMITVFSSQGDTLKDKLLDGEIAANMILLAFVSLGWISRARYLSAHWKWIAAGFVTLVGWDLTVTIFWKFFWTARQFYPLGTIAAYVVWIAAPLRGLSEFRASLGKRLELPKETYTRVM